MAVTRINTNQINDAQVTAAKIAPYTLTGGLFSNTITLNSNISVIGNLDVQGNTTTINSVNTYVNDPIITFNNGYAGAPSYDIGILINRNLGPLTGYGNYNTAWIWDESADTFTGVVTTEVGNSPGGTINKSYYANLKIGNVSVVNSLTSNTITIAAGLQNTPIGNATPSTGAFTYGYFGNLSTGNAVITGGYISALANAYITDFSTGNAVITGGYLSGLANITATTGNVNTWYAANLNSTTANITTGNIITLNATTGNVITLLATNLSSGNVVITGGYINSVANINATAGNITTLVASNFSSGNVKISGGYIDSVANVYATTGTFTNLSSGNAVITGGYIQSVANVYATTGQFTNLSTANAVITGGYINSVANVNATAGNITTLVAPNFSSANAVITGGYINAVANVNATDGNITTLVASNFSSGNVKISGGYIDSVANVYAGTAQFGNLSTGNAVITGGYIQTVANVYAGTAQFGNLSTANAVITGGYIDSVANVYAGTARFGNLSTGNAVISGGYIQSVTNVYATTAQFTNLSTGNAVITGGYIQSVTNVYATTAQFTNLSTGNAVITGGYLSGLANITATTGNVDSWYAGVLNATTANITTGNINNFSTANARISGGYADNFAIGANVAGPASFTTANTTGNLGVGGNAIVTNTLYAANIVTTGASGNISGVNYLLTANIIATANAQASWFLGNVKGATGNLTTIDANVVAASYVKSDNYQFANGDPFISTSIANTVEITANISSGQNLGLLLANTSVTPGIYGSASAIPTVVVDSKGRVTSITTNVAATGFNLAADTGTGVVNAATILTISGTANEIETSVSANAFTIGLPNDVVISTLYATNLSTGNARIASGYADNFAIGANTAATGAFTTLTASGLTTITNSQASNGTASGALVVTGGVGIGGNLNIAQNAYIGGNLSVTGTLTYINSTVVSLLDPILELNTGANGVGLGTTTSNDVGIRAHYYDGADQAGFFGRVNATGNFEYFAKVTSETGNVITGTYGTIKSGNLIVANTTQSTAANTGAFQVYGGGSIIGNLYVGNIFASGGNIGIMSNVASRLLFADNIFAGNVETENLLTGNAVISGGYINAVANVYAGTAQFGNLSSANAVFSGGYISSMSNVYAGTAQFGNLSTANAVITGGYINAVTNVYATTAQFTNLSTGNAVITGGYINAVTNVYATTAQFTNLSTGNAVITGGYINAVANVYAGTAQFGNLSTGNAVITGGYINAVANVYAGTAQFGNLSTGNAVITGGYINAVANVNATDGNITTLVAPNFSSANAVITGGYINSVANVNATAGNITTLVAPNFSSANAVITGGYINSVANVYATTAGFTNLSTGNAVITGGYINSVTNVYATTAQFTNLSTGNAVISGGYISAMTNITATTGNVDSWYVGAINATTANITTGNINNFSTGNAVIGGGYISAMTNITATTGNVDSWYVGNLNATNANITGTLFVGNFSTGNAVLSGGYISSMSNITANTARFGNLSSANAVLSGGYISSMSNIAANTAQFGNLDSGNAYITGGTLNNTIIGNATPASGKFTNLNVTSNVYLAPTTGAGTVTINPINISSMDNMSIGASYSANAYVTNFKSTTSIEAGTSGRIWLNAGTLSGSGINNIPIGAVTPAAATFTTANTTGNLTIGGEVSVTGNIVPSANVIYSLGTSTNRFKDIWLSGQTEYLGGAIIAEDTNGNLTLTTSGGNRVTLVNTAANSVVLTGNVVSPYFLGNVVGTNGTITNVTAVGLQAQAIGNITPGTGAFTTITANSTITANGNIVANSGTTSANVSSGALVVVGGAGISGNVNLGGNLTIGGNINSASNIVINSNKSVNTDFAVRGKNENSLIYAISNSVFDQVVIGGNITTANVTQGAKLAISSTDSLLVPVGTTSDRPSGQGFTDVAGMLRFNSTTSQLEYYDSTQWIAPSTVLTIITSTQYALASGNPAGNVDGTNVDFTLPSAATTNSVIVSINGIVQLPTVAYSVINSGLTLRFTEAPAIDDVVDVRILTTTSSISQLQSPNGLNVINIDNGNVTISTGNVSTGSIDRWHFDVKGDFIPQTTANIGNADHRVNYLFASNINIQGGALSGVSIAGTSFDNIPIGGNIASTGAFTSLYATTFANVPTLNVNNSATIGSSLSLGSSLLLDDSSGYSVLNSTTGMVAKFDKTVYRSGKYLIQLTKSDNSEFQSAEVMVVHNGTTPTIEVYAVTYTGASALGSFTSNISGSDVNINATALAGDVNAKVHATLMKL